MTSARAPRSRCIATFARSRSASSLGDTIARTRSGGRRPGRPVSSGPGLEHRVAAHGELDLGRERVVHPTSADDRLPSRPHGRAVEHGHIAGARAGSGGTRSPRRSRRRRRSPRPRSPGCLPRGAPCRGHDRSAPAAAAPPQVGRAPGGPRCSPGAPVTPPPGWAPAPHRYRPRTGVAYLAQPGTGRMWNSWSSADVAVEDVALGQAVLALQVERRQHLPGDDRGGHVRREPADPASTLSPSSSRLPSQVPSASR